MCVCASHCEVCDDFLKPCFHVLVRQSGCRDMSAEIFCLIETLHKWSCQAALQTECTTAVKREFLGQRQQQRKEELFSKQEQCSVITGWIQDNRYSCVTVRLQVSMLFITHWTLKLVNYRLFLRSWKKADMMMWQHNQPGDAGYQFHTAVFTFAA